MLRSEGECKARSSSLRSAAVFFAGNAYIYGGEWFAFMEAMLAVLEAMITCVVVFCAEVPFMEVDSGFVVKAAKEECFLR